MTELISVFKETYHTLASWVYAHPIRADVILIAVVVGSIWFILRRNRIARSRAYRLIWGEIMKRKDQEAYQRMKFEDAIVDAGMEMVNRGDMTPAQEEQWYAFFTNTYNMKGLAPLKNLDSLKRGLKMRLRLGWWAKIPLIPGGKPGGPVDPTYKPVIEPAVERKGLETSKYI